MTLPHEINIDRQVEADYVLERLQEVRDIVGGLLDSFEMAGLDPPVGGLSALESIAAASHTAARVWTR